jgi:hypothetical protein
MKRIISFISLLTLFSMQAAAQQPHRRHPSFHHHRNAGQVRPVRFHSPRYRLDKRVFVKWVPSALIPISATSVRFGAEYCTAGNIGLALEAGYVLGSTSRTSPNYRFGGKGGIILNPEARLYFGFRSRGRGFAGLQGLVRIQQFPGMSGNLGIGGYTYEYTQSGATLYVVGAAPEMGFVARLAGNCHLEMDMGIGVKHISWDRRDLTTRKIYDSFHNYLEYPEDGVLDRDYLPYFFAQIKFSWLLGSPIAGRHK